MALSVCSILAVSLTLCVVLQKGYGLPLSNPTEAAPPQQLEQELPVGSSLAQVQQQKHHVRAKRCSCNSWLDKECIYFCHLDIIWVNTPSKILPYGLGSPLSRRRRSAAGRCECASTADETCSSFCHNSSETPAIIIAGPLVQTDGPSDTNSNRLLASLRSLIRSNMASSAKRATSPGKKSPRTHRLRIR